MHATSTADREDKMRRREKARRDGEFILKESRPILRRRVIFYDGQTSGHV